MRRFEAVWLLLLSTTLQTGASAGTEFVSSSNAHWWENAIVYEVYPRSFQDSNGDGIGDLNGITRRLDYLKDLGVDAIWIAPMYPSPQVDFGYDISNFESIDPQYGTLADFDRLNEEAQKRGIRVLIDFVPNHTSDHHPWFLDARSSRQSSHRDWYVWSDGKRGPNGEPAPPNNWVTYFGGAAWEWDSKTSQFYYHAYYKEQPDLNWRDIAVQKAMFDVMRFWLDRGVGGFRLDSIPDLFEDKKLRDDPAVKAGQIEPEQRIFTTNRPEVHAIVRKMRALLDSYPGDRVLIGETSLPNIRDMDRWYGGAAHNELQLPMDSQVGYVDKLDATKFKHLLTEIYTQVHGSEPLFYIDCHDSDRSWDRYGDGNHNQDIAKLMAAVLLTSKATVILYQGQEIGQVTSKPTRLEDVKDPVGKTRWPTNVGRDGERTPMQWDDSAQAGFSTNLETWLPVSANYRTVNVKTELHEPKSLLNWYRQLISLRRTHGPLRNGAVTLLDGQPPEVLAYTRTDKAGEAVLIGLNMSSSAKKLLLKGVAQIPGAKELRTLLTNPLAPTVESKDDVELPPFGVWIAAYTKSVGALQ